MTIDRSGVQFHHTKTVHAALPLLPCRDSKSARPPFTLRGKHESMTIPVRHAVKKLLNRASSVLGYEVRRVTPRIDMRHVPDARFYTPLFSPWRGYGEFKHLLGLAQPHTLVSPDRCYVLSVLASQAIRLGGDVWECGVYKGGTAILLAELIALHKASNANCKLHLFDTFEGMPETDPRRDLHKKGDFSDTSLATVRERVGKSELTVYHPGFIPNTFIGLESSEIVFAHVDVDIYQSVLDCCAFIVPRLKRGGFIVFDDYGFPSCPGARQAVDEFFGETQWNPLVLSTGQAVIFSS